MISENYSFKSPFGHQSQKALKRSSHILAVKQPWYISTKAGAATTPTRTVVLSLYATVLRVSLIITSVCVHSSHNAKAFLHNEEWLSISLLFIFQRLTVQTWTATLTQPFTPSLTQDLKLIWRHWNGRGRTAKESHFCGEAMTKCVFLPLC